MHTVGWFSCQRFFRHAGSRAKMRRSAPRFLAALSLLWLALSVISSAQSWNLSWSDEFNGAANSAIDAANWAYDTGVLNVNNEIEYYCAQGSKTAPCTTSTPNAYIDGSGHLIIKAIKINSSVEPNGGSWTSARLKTQGLQSFQYGRLESSMKLPIGAGIWPAYWALGANINTVGWPSSGEMDFMENVPAAGGQGPTIISSTIHGGNSDSSCYCGGHGLGAPYTFPANDPNGPDVTSFHAYGAIWSPNMIQFYVDDPHNVFLVKTVNDLPAGQPWDFNHPFFAILNLAIGGTGSWPGPPDNNTPNPAIMTVDYVRVYKPSAITGPAMSGTPISVKAGTAGSSTLTLNSSSGSGRVYMACTTTAPKATCAIHSSDALNQYTVDFSQSATATATVNVTTTATTTTAGLWRRLGNWAFLAGTFGVFGMLLLPARMKRRAQHYLGGAGLTLALIVHPGCGGGGQESSGVSRGNNNFTVTVSAYTVGSGGNADSTVNIPLTIN